MPHIVGKLFLFGHGASKTINYLFHLAKQSQLVFLYLLDSRNCLRSFGQEGAHDASMTWWPFFCSITRESFHQCHCPQSPLRRWGKKLPGYSISLFGNPSIYHSIYMVKLVHTHLSNYILSNHIHVSTYPGTISDLTCAVKS